MTSDQIQDQTLAPRAYHWDFPLELWRAIFEFIFDKRDLSCLAAACRTFQQEAEALLYRVIELESNAAIISLSSALVSRPRRAASVRTLTIRRLDSAHVQVLNGVLRSCTALTALHIRPSYKPEMVLAGCTFQLSQFTTLFGPDSRTFHPFLASQARLQDLDIGNLCRIFSASKKGLLPYLRKLRASQDVIAQLSADQIRNITHLGISVSTSAEVQRVLALFGPQLVSLNVSKPSEVASGEIITGLTPSAVPHLVFLEFVEKKLHTSVLTEFMPLDEKQILTHGLSARTFVWNINCDNKVKDADIWERRYANVHRFALTVLRSRPAPERFVYVMQNAHVVCTLGDEEELIEREDPRMYYTMWRDVQT